MLVHVTPVSIEWGQCDPAGIVFYPRYFEIFDNCLAGLFRHALGLTKYQMIEKWQIAGFPSVETRAKFSKPCKFGDSVAVHSSITEFRRSSFDINHRLVHEDGSLAVEGFDTRVWTARDPADPGRIRSQPLPAELIAAFE
jgi:4-hydroxybenzoyl-CoA thioesterase